MLMDILDTWGIGDTYGEVVNWSQIVESKCEKNDFNINASLTLHLILYHMPR